MKWLTTLLGCLLLALVAGCSGMQARDFEGTEPKLDLFAYFEGKTRAWGVFQSRSGEVKRQFTVDIRGTVDGDLLTLEEDFVYTDGETSRRVWTIRRVDEHRFEGEAADVVGKASGLSYGQALNWRYRLQLPFKGSTLEVDFDDWMLLQADDVLINRAVVRKFGFRVGEVTLFFQRAD